MNPTAEKKMMAPPVKKGMNPLMGDERDPKS